MTRHINEVGGRRRRALKQRRGRQARRRKGSPDRTRSSWRLALVAAVLVAGLGAGWLLLGRSSAVEPEEAHPTASWLPARGSVAALKSALQAVCARPAPPHDERAVTAELCGMEPALIELVNEGGQAVPLAVLVADTFREQIAGYQFIGEAVIAETAILFVYRQDISGPFHMCNVRAPLDMIWFRWDGSVVHAARAQPGPRMSAGACPALYGPASSQRYRYVLETPAGALDDLGVKVETLRLRLSGVAAP